LKETDARLFASWAGLRAAIGKQRTMRGWGRLAAMYGVCACMLLVLGSIALAWRARPLFPFPAAPLPPSAHCALDEVVVFWHGAEIGVWREVMEEQLATLHACGLYDRCSKLALGFLGSRDVLKPFLAGSPKLELVYNADDVQEQEAPTLGALRAYCLERDTHEFAVLYMHTKGATHRVCSRQGVAVSGQKAWRKMMEHWLLWRYEVCLEKLREGYLTCGVNLHVDHYAGNFWWARASHIRTLGPVIAPSAKRTTVEDWILAKRSPGRHLSLAANMEPSMGCEGLYAREVQLVEYDARRETAL